MPEQHIFQINDQVVVSRLVSLSDGLQLKSLMDWCSEIRKPDQAIAYINKLKISQHICSKHTDIRKKALEANKSKK